jgi:hypothetical protein
MKTLEAQVPEILMDEVIELAAKQNTSVDHIVSLALTAQVSAWRVRESIASRARRVDWEKVDKILARVPDVPALLGDEL